MLELARGISQWAHGLKKGVIFLFNTGEEDGLNGAHSFITQVWNYLVMHRFVGFIFASQPFERHESFY